MAAELLVGAHDGALVHRGDACKDAGVLHAVSPEDLGLQCGALGQGLYYTILYYTILYYANYTILYYTILYNAILYYTIPYYTVLWASWLKLSSSGICSSSCAPVITRKARAYGTC